MDVDNRVRAPLRAIRTLAVATATAVVFALLPTAPAAPASASAADLFTFDGGGWGHSVGMSQYGALGMSQEGFTWQDIVTHYFTGSSTGPVAEDLRQPIWVNLTQENQALTFRVLEIGPDAVPVTFTIGGQSVAVAPGQVATVTRLENGNCDLTAPSGTYSGDCSVDGSWDGWIDSPSTAIEITGCYKTNWNIPGGPISQPCRYSRGTLHIRPDNNTNTVDSSIEIDIEAYLLGVSEMPYRWADEGGVAALQAQAVAARSYAYARVRIRPDPTARPWCWCQLYDTVYDQNYVGYGHGTQEWIDIVRSTEHEILTHPEVTVEGRMVPISTFYSSSTFDRTENSEDSFLNPVVYLKSVDDHWSRLPSVNNPFATWSRSFSGSQLTSLLPNTSSVTSAAITACSETGAALEITFNGANGSWAFRTRELRSRLNLRSQQIVRLTTPDSSSTCAGEEPTTTTTTVPPTTTTTTVPPTTTTTTVPPTTTTTTVPPTTTTTTVPPTTTTVTGAATDAACSNSYLSIDALLSKQRELGYGSQGADVADVQRLLQALAHYDDAVDGRFGRLTTAAVRSFQDARGLKIDGFVGPRTRGELASLHSAAAGGIILAADGTLLARGVSSATVRTLQSALQLLGFAPGPIDGRFGSQTTAAVLLFQQSQNLLADGVVGVQSRAALTQALNLQGYITCDG